MAILGRIIRNGNQYEVVELDQVKQQQLIDKTIEVNLEILRKCIKAVCQWYRKNGLTAWGDYEREFIIATYNAVCMKVSTVMALELAKEVRQVKANGNGEA